MTKDLTGGTAAATTELESLLGANGLRIGYQRVVDLLDRNRLHGVIPVPVGPRGTGLADPRALESAAATMGLSDDLAAARWEGVLELLERTGEPTTLFVQGDADTLLQLPDLCGRPEITAVIQVEVRALTERPGHLLRLIDQARALGWLIGVRNVGADTMSLPLIAVLDPDVLTLDPLLLGRRPDRLTAQVVSAVRIAKESGGVLVICEGVDTERDRRAAIALGADAGVGAMFLVPPVPTGAVSSRPRHGPPITGLWGVTDGGVRRAERGRIRAIPPFRIAQHVQEGGIGDKRLLIEISKHLEALAFEPDQRPLLIGSFQSAHHFTPATARRWSTWAQGSALTVALAQSLSTDPAPNVRGVALDPSDPLCEEWDVVVLAGQISVVLTARDLGDRGPDLERRFEYVLTHNRSVTLDIARSLLSRVPADVTR